MCIQMTVYEITSTDIVSWFFDKYEITSTDIVSWFFDKYEITSTDIVSWFFDKEPRNNVCTCDLIYLPKKMFRILCDCKNSNSIMFQECTAHFAICVIMYIY